MPDSDIDFHGQADDQAALLRAGRLADAKIADRIENMGQSGERKLVHRLTLLHDLLNGCEQADFRFATTNPWSFDDAMNDDYLPR